MRMYEIWFSDGTSRIVFCSDDATIRARYSYATEIYLIEIV